MHEKTTTKEKQQSIKSFLRNEGPSRLWKLERDLVGETKKPFKSKQNMLYHIKKLLGQGEAKHYKSGRSSLYYLPGQELPDDITRTQFFIRNPGRVIRIIDRAIDDVLDDPLGLENLYTRDKFEVVASSVYNIITSNLEEFPDFPERLYPLVYFDSVEDWWVDVHDIMGKSRSEAGKWLVMKKERSKGPGGREFKKKKWELPGDRKMIPPGCPESPRKMFAWLVEVADWLEGHS